MNWTDNAILSFLEKDHRGPLKNLKDFTNMSVLITVTDNTMYDRYQKDDTVRIKLTDVIPEEADCLIIGEDEKTALFKHVKDTGDYYEVSQTFPPETERVGKDEVDILGYATSILRV